jgi:hypothetical protein
MKPKLPAGVAPPSRAVLVACVACAAIAVIVHFVDADTGAVNAVKIVSSTLTVLFVPGVLLLLLFRLHQPLTLLETAGLGAALTFGLLAVLTILTMLVHAPLSASAVVLVAAISAMSLIAWRRAGVSDLTAVSGVATEWWLLAGLAATAVLLYLIGSPASPSEDQIHIAVARRLAALPQPSIFNVYLTPDIVYTYPFPTTHVIFALVSLVGGVDVLLVYQKLRFAWSIIALLSVYVAAKRLFEDATIAAVCGWTGVVFVAVGVFGYVPKMMWAQLAPFSHASDVAMGVLLPLLIVSTFHYLAAADRRDTVLFGVTAFLMVIAVATAHIKEVIQYFVYLASFGVVALLLGQRRSAWARSGILLAASLAVALAYIGYHRLLVPNVDSIVRINRDHIVEISRALKGTAWLYPPLNDGKIVNNFNLFFYNLNPLVLLAMPVVCAAFVRRRLLEFVWASVFAYFVIMAVPALSIAYLLASYYDMLSTPVRNVVFFIYVIAGALVYMAARLAARLKHALLGFLVLAALAWMLPIALLRLQKGLSGRPAIFLAAVIIGLPVMGYFGTTRTGRRFGDAFLPPVERPRFWAGVTVLLGCLGVFLFQPLSALTAWKAPAVHTLEQAIAAAQAPLMAGVYPVRGTTTAVKDNGSADVPPPPFVQWMTRNVPADAIVAANLFNGNVLTTFIPQRLLAWPIAYHHPVNYCINFARYCAAADASAVRYGVLPFFNTREDREERLRFLREFNITYVVLDPDVAGEMKPVLAAYPDLFRELYSELGWHVFSVHVPGR